MEERLVELIVDTLAAKALYVQTFVHYFIVYFAVYLLHEDEKVGKLSLWYGLLFFGMMLIPYHEEYFFHRAVGYELLLIFTTVAILKGTRLIILVLLSSVVTIMNILMYEFPYTLDFLYINYKFINRIFLETTLAALLYDHKSKKRNLVIFLIMILIYTHEF